MAEIKVLNKTFDILEFVVSRKGVGVLPSEIVKNFGITQATAIRLLKILVDLGYLEQISRLKGYVPGPMLFLLQSGSEQFTGIVDKLDAVMERCARETCTLITICRKHHDFRYVLKSWDGTGDAVQLNVKLRYGDLHKCMTGSVLLAYSSDRELQEFVRRHGIPSDGCWPENNTEERFLQELQNIRDRKINTTYYSGCGIAALPVFSHDELSVVMGVLWKDVDRSKDARRLELLRQCQHEATELLSGKKQWYNAEI